MAQANLSVRVDEKDKKVLNYFAMKQEWMYQ